MPDKAPPIPPPSLGSGGSSPTWLGDANHTWGGASVLFAAGYAGEDVVIPRPGATDLPPADARDAGARFEQLMLLGRGGMGEVWRVRDADLNRVVAMKIIRVEAGVSDAVFARFVAEAQATAQLEHPGIVPVYELGRLPDGRIYYTMQEIRGRDLAAILTDLHRASTPQAYGAHLGWTFAGVLDAFRQVTETVAFAHARGVIHRDLKPANIMLGAFGEVRVVDWGLVKVLDRSGQSSGASDARSGQNTPHTRASGDSATNAGAVAGTRGYMSPEQASGAIDRLSPASDVFALGGILFAILSGRAPEDGVDVLRVLGAQPRVPAALAEICARAMASAPEDRFADASALAAAIGAWQARAAAQEQARAQVEHLEQSFQALPEPLQDEARELLLQLYGRDGRPLPRPAADLAGAALDALLAANIVAISNDNVLVRDPAQLQRWDRLTGWLDAERDALAMRQALHDQATIWEARGRPRGHLWRGEQLAELEAWRRQRVPRLSAVERTFADTSVHEEQRGLRRRRMGTVVLVAVLTLGLVWALLQERETRAALKAAESARDAEQAALRTAEGRALSARSSLASAEGDPHAALALALGAAERLAGDPGQRAQLLSLAASTDPVQVFAGHQGYVYHTEWAGPDRFVSSSIDRTLRLWDARSGDELARMETSAAAVTIAVSPDGRRVATILENGSFELWDLATRTRLASDPAHQNFGHLVAFSSDGALVMTCATDDRVRIWDGQSGALLQTLTLGERGLPLASLAQRSERVLTRSERVQVWDARSGALLLDVPEPAEGDMAAISPDGSTVFVGNRKGTITRWDVDGGPRRWQTTPRPDAPLWTLQVSPDGRRLVAGTADGQVMLLDTQTGEPIGGNFGHTTYVTDLSFSADGGTLLSHAADGSLVVWDLPQMASLARYNDPSGRVPVARISPEGARVLIAAYSGVARIWTPRRLSARRADLCGGLPAILTASSWHGALLAFKTSAGLCVRPTASDSPLPAVQGIDERVIALSGDGQHVVTVNKADRILSRDGQTGAQRWTFDPGQKIYAAGLSESARSVILQRVDQRLLILDALTGAVRATTVKADIPWAALVLQEQTAQPILPVQQSDLSTALYDVETGARLRDLRAGMVNINSPFSIRSWARGGRLSAGDEQGWLRVWETGKDAPVFERQLGTAAIHGVAVHEAAGRLAAIDADGVLNLFDLATLSEAGRVETGDPMPNRLSFSPDGSLIVTMTDLGVVRVWDTQTGEAVLGVPNTTPGAPAGACVVESGELLSWDNAGYRLWSLERPALGSQTNLRPCRGSERVVPVQPFPAPELVWAPEAACASAG